MIHSLLLVHNRQLDIKPAMEHGRHVLQQNHNTTIGNSGL